MKRFFRARFLFLLSTLFVFTIFSGPLFAQAPNLLANPGFEKPFESVAGNPPRQVAQGWTPWHISGGQSASENVQPEYYAASDVSNGLGVPRIRNGSEAQQYHSFFATHDGGLFQRVTGVTKGAQLRFSAYIYAWSSTFDDPNKSEDAGGIVVQVGVDPLGGTDGTSNSIVWSAPSIQYDAYNEYSVTATAADTAVTVFVRSTVTTPVKNNNLYVDDAALVVATGGSASTSTSVPATATKSATATSTSVPPTATSTTAPASASPTTASGSSATTAPSNTAVPSTAIPAATATTTPIPPTSTSTSVPPTVAGSPATATVPAPAPTATTAINTNDFPGRVVHIVQPGDTVGVLATVYGSTTDAIIQANGLTPSALIRVGQGLVIPVRLNAPATSTPTATPIAPAATATISNTGTGAPPNSYVVQPGDTLGRIAARFNTTITTLAQLNGITNPNTIYVGQRLVIPGTGQVVSQSTPVVVVVTATSAPAAQTTYVVQPGDTLFRIALRFRIPMSQLAQANGITNFNRVFVGQVLVIP